MMDRSSFEEGINDIRKGERVRVLFDMMMETLTGKETGDEQMSKGAFFELIKTALMKEHEALTKIMPSAGGPQKGIRKVKKDTPMK